MTQLYTTLAEVYHDIYQHIFNYDKEFLFYDVILKSHNCRNILEVGCGSGMLARRFLENGYDYLGLDLSNEMLDIARRELKSDNFIQSDMRMISFDQQFEAILITGRSIAYITDNKGIIDTLTGIHRALINNGLLVFDVFDAHQIFDNLDDFEQIIEHNGKKIRRISKLNKNLSSGWTYDWSAKYIIEQNNELTKYDDMTTLRAFTRDEVNLFMKLTGFNCEEIRDEGRMFTIIAKKI